MLRYSLDELRYEPKRLKRKQLSVFQGISLLNKRLERICEKLAIDSWSIRRTNHGSESKNVGSRHCDICCQNASGREHPREVIIKCTHGCTILLHNDCFLSLLSGTQDKVTSVHLPGVTMLDMEKRIARALSLLKVEGSHMLTIAGPRLKDRQCPNCLLGAISFVASIDVKMRSLSQWIQHPLVEIVTVDENLENERNSKSLAEEYPGCTLYQSLDKNVTQKKVDEMKKIMDNHEAQVPLSLSDTLKYLSSMCNNSPSLGEWKRLHQSRPGLTIMITGPCGSGKTSILRHLSSGVNMSSSIKWDPEKAIVSHFSTPNIKVEKNDEKLPEGVKWLSCMGLNSIPAWCRPYHALSTGQKYRATLARMLFFSSQSSRERLPLLLDDFAHSLDLDTARCVACSLAAHLRRNRVRVQALKDEIKRGQSNAIPPLLVICTSQPILSKWLQPDILLELGMSSKVLQMKVNTTPFSKPKINFNVNLNVNASKRDKQENNETKTKTSIYEGDEFSSIGHIEYKKALPLPTFERKRKNNKGSIVSKSIPQALLYSKVYSDCSTESLDALFDLPFRGVSFTPVPHIPSREEIGPFRLGVICGPSGSSKTVIAKYYFNGPTPVEWNTEKTIFQHFNAKTAKKVLSTVCLSEHVWDRKFDELSRGEKESANVARLLNAPGSVFDEFGSNLDPVTRRKVCCQISEYYHSIPVPKPSSSTPSLIVVTCACRPDLYSGALKPDWLLDTRTLTFYKFYQGHEDLTSRGKPLSHVQTMEDQLKSPFSGAELNLTLRPSDGSLWKPLFASHHYKSASLSRRSQSFLLETSEKATFPIPVGIVAVIPQTGSFIGSGHRKSENVTSNVSKAFRAHRTVVLPQWQGMGLGSRLSDAAGEIFVRQGYRYFGQTVHPRFGMYRDRSPLWISLPWNHSIQKYKCESWSQLRTQTHIRLRRPRIIFAHEYVGVPAEMSAELKPYFDQRMQFHKYVSPSV